MIQSNIRRPVKAKAVAEKLSDYVNAFDVLLWLSENGRITATTEDCERMAKEYAVAFASPAIKHILEAL